METKSASPLNIATSRRQFLKVSGTAAGGFALALPLSGCSSFPHTGIDDQGNWRADAWLEITPDNQVIFTLDRVEMGQGTYTGLTTLLAEELDVPPEDIDVVFAPAAKVYRNPDYGLQLTGGSNSLATSWTQIRQAGAAARDMLKAAAAEVFQVPVVYLKAENTRIVHPASGKSLTYGSLAKLAAEQEVPESPALRKPETFKYIGKLNKRLDAKEKVTGQAGYGIDVVQENMRYAVVSRSPYVGDNTENADHIESHNADEVRQMKGVIEVVEIRTGIAIVAESYWRARKAQEELKIKWRRPDNHADSTRAVFDLYRQRADEDEGDNVREDGDLEQAIEDASEVFEAEYEAPFLAHATMEPMSCTAHVQDKRADIWTGTQAPDIAQVIVAKVTDLSLSEVHIHNQFLGGGFGRRLTQDFIGEAAEISHLTGQIIKLVWSREEDTQNDFYRPASLHRMRAAIDENGEIEGWDHQIICPKIMDWYVWNAAPAMFSWAPKFMYTTLGYSGLWTEGTPLTPADRSPYEGAVELAYDIPAVTVRHTKADAGVPVSYWRSVGHSHNGFVTEGFIDELAEKTGRDAYQFRRDLLKNAPRWRAVLDAVAKQGNWGRQTEKDVYQGIAVHESFGSFCAQLVELSVADGMIQIKKVVCAIDCGIVVNPDVVTMQMESGIIFGITAALYGQIDIEDGKIRQSNFDDYQMLRLNQSPEIHTIIMDSNAEPTGVGEPGLPPVAPAIAGALYQATGKRYRKMPFTLS